MTKKPTQKLNNSLRFTQFKTFLALLFVFVQIAGFFGTPTKQASAATCSLTSSDQMAWDFAANRTRVGWDEFFDVVAIASFKTGQEEVSAACALAKDDYDIRIYLYSTSSGVSTGDYSPGVLISGGGYFKDGIKGSNSIGSGFAGRKSMTVKQLATAGLPEPGTIQYNTQGVEIGRTPDPNPHYLRAFIWNNKTNNYENVYSNSVPLAYSKNSTGETPTTLPGLPTGINPDTSTTPTVDTADTVPFDALFFKVSIDSAKEDKFRNFYRITYDKGGFVAVAQKPENGRTNRENQLMAFSAFDQAGGIPVKLALGQKSTISSLRVGSSGHNISYSKIGQQFSNISYLTSQTHRVDSVKTISIEQNLTKDKSICGVSVFSATQYFCDSAKSKNNGATTGDVLLGKDQGLSTPFLLGSAPAMSAMGLNADGKTLNTVLVLPTINLKSDWTQWIVGGIAVGLTAGGAAPAFFSTMLSPPGFTYAAEPTQKVYFEVYPTKEALEAAKDNPIPDSVGEYAEVETGNTESSGKGLGDTLLDFIRKVITHLLSLMTSLVYYVFSFIIAPFLVAILKIQAYKDDFVSVIYPGWLILRNISNIFFIVALLAIGLGTMFRISGYQARSLIIDLILMALLINFSLVFAQGIVALADTIQYQFLPGDSAVVNALAAKLMVEPLQMLRDSTGGVGFGVSTAIADISKAFVLLMFAVAALFAFIAVGAFLLVRLIALWVLYLLSPIAYVAYVLPQTKKYMSQWWGEFIKYAFVGAAMAFFLNMAALLAGGDFFQRSGFGGEGFAAGTINLVLMFAQNLAVIGFMVVGMKMAQKSGIAGSKAILGFAEKGTKALTTNLAKNKAKQVYERRIEGGMLDPRAWKKSWKDSSDEKTKGIKNARLQKNEGKLSPSNIINKPGASLKYAWNKYTGRGANPLLAQAEGMQDESKILDDNSRQIKMDKLAEDNGLLPAAQEAKDNLDNGKIGLSDVDEVMASIDEKMDAVREDHKDKIIGIEEEILKKEEAIQKARLETQPGRPNVKLDRLEQEKQDLEQERTALNNDPDYQQEMNDLTAQKAALEIKMDNARNAGETTLDISALDNIESFNKEAYKDKVEKNLTKLNSEIGEINSEIEADDLRRQKFGYGEFGSANAKSITPERREEIKASVKDITARAASRSLPISLASRARRLEAVKEAEKQLELIDDFDELSEMFAKSKDDSMKEAILKKMAKSGGSSHLLGKLGYKNNSGDMQRMMDKHFSGTSTQIRYQIGAEAGKLNADNGNLAASNLVKVKDGVIQWATTEESHKAIGRAYAKKNPQDLAKMKSNDAMVQVSGSTGDNTAKYEMHPEYVKVVNGLNGDARVRDFKKGLTQAHATALKDSRNFLEIKNPEILRAIHEAAGETK